MIVAEGVAIFSAVNVQAFHLPRIPRSLGQLFGEARLIFARIAIPDHRAL